MQQERPSRPGRREVSVDSMSPVNSSFSLHLEPQAETYQEEVLLLHDDVGI